MIRRPPTSTLFPYPPLSRPHVLPFPPVPQARARLEQGLLEGKRAAEDEGDQVLAQERADVADVRHRLAVAEDAVARHVGADVEVFAERGKLRLPRLRSGEERAGLGIALAEEHELLCIFARQDADIALHVARREPCGVARVLAAADCPAHLAGIIHGAQ